MQSVVYHFSSFKNTETSASYRACPTLALKGLRKNLPDLIASRKFCAFPKVGPWPMFYYLSTRILAAFAIGKIISYTFSSKLQSISVWPYILWYEEKIFFSIVLHGESYTHETKYLQSSEHTESCWQQCFLSEQHTACE